MDASRRYKVKVPNMRVFEEARHLLEQHARILLTNPRRNTIAAMGLDEQIAEKLRGMNATIVEDTQYALD